MLSFVAETNLGNIALIALGLAFLIIAGDLLVRGAVSLATLMKVPTLLISLTIVAFGTSAPEFVVTLKAMMGGGPGAGIAMGNIIGSNTANVLLVLGLPAIITPIAMALPGLRRHAVAMLVATVVFCAFIYGPKQIDTTAGVILVAMIIAYIAYIGLHAARSDVHEPVLDELEEFTEGSGGWKIPVFLITGLIGLPFGAQLLVDNGAALAASYGVRQELIGLTIVAFGTSLPELATVWAAAMRKQADVAVGNIVGSNIFNLLFVGGTAGLVGTATFSDTARAVDVPVMIGATAILALMIFAKGKISRPVGIAFFLAYIGYIAYIATASAL